MMKIEIQETDNLEPGDEIELHYRMFGATWIRAAQAALLERRLQNQNNFVLLSSEYNKNSIILRCKIIKPREIDPRDAPVQEAGIVSAALIIKAVAVVSAGVLVWLSLDTIYKITESPAGKIAVGGLGMMAIVSGIVGLLAILKK